MYNLLVSANPEAWNGEPWQIETGRCVNEYTDDRLRERFGALTPDKVAALVQLPCIFAYESAREQNPRFGIIREVTIRQGQARIEYDIHTVEPFLTREHFEKLTFELDIAKWELNRTHWAVKDVDLAKELHRQGVTLPAWARGIANVVDITKHEFAVALSFPGEARRLVEDVAANVEGRLGPHTYFYDNNYTAQLARPSLDVLLQDIYRNRSRLIVVFLGADYQRKEWCGLELRAIRDIIKERGYDRIMLVRLDDGEVEGVFKTDGYVDARKHSAVEIARFIEERAALAKLPVKDA
ncbi:MAG: TIR domain-containing protein [Aquamicrobium sp.]|nr:TIR domain-containing protein [Aquamicrobium sp.]MBR2803967.1 TIR domain-containing protein [Eggerthellaceae bacterium]